MGPYGDRLLSAHIRPPGDVQRDRLDQSTDPDMDTMVSWPSGQTNPGEPATTSSLLAVWSRRAQSRCNGDLCTGCSARSRAPTSLARQACTASYDDQPPGLDAARLWVGRAREPDAVARGDRYRL
ncbi:hypothetical protein GCM10010178_89210 [Lentzea flava]|uniref:Uncharacterized protein n=1 Tax=Lentzea flava TaxID=103732 RepID=A0ABQ2VIP9_9PSEU|nr:hypothetical protein GCM10010178_89210 [Lentzea flava]